MEKIDFAELKLKLTLSMGSKMYGFPYVFHRFSIGPGGRKIGFAEFKLGLALNMASKMYGFPNVERAVNRQPGSRAEDP